MALASVVGIASPVRIDVVEGGGGGVWSCGCCCCCWSSVDVETARREPDTIKFVLNRGA